MLRPWSQKTKRDSRHGRAGCGLQSAREDADLPCHLRWQRPGGAVRAEAYRGVPPYVEFVVTAGEGLNIRNKVVATFDGLQIRRITTTG